MHYRFIFSTSQQSVFLVESTRHSKSMEQHCVDFFWDPGNVSASPNITLPNIQKPADALAWRREDSPPYGSSFRSLLELLHASLTPGPF